MDLNFSERYHELLSVYNIMGPLSSPDAVFDLTCILRISNVTNIASRTARERFHLKNLSRSLSFSVSDPYSPFSDANEVRARDLFLKTLNDYLRVLESHRYGQKKLLAFYAYIMTKGMTSLLRDLYIPDTLRDAVEEVLAEQSKKLNDLVQEAIHHFDKFENPKLTSIVKSLDRLLLEQRTDQVINNLKKYEPNIDEGDWEYLGSLRSEFTKYSNSLRLEYLKEKFGLAESTYRTYVSNFVVDLVSRMDEDSKKLLTDIFLKNG